MAAEDYLDIYDYYNQEYWINHNDPSEDTMNRDENLCPDCNGPMISRNGKFGTFWGCKKFPECKGTRDSMGQSKKDRAIEKGEGTMYEDGKGIVNIVEKDTYSFNKKR